MFGNRLSSSTSGLTLKDTLELANKHLEDASNASSPAMAQHHCDNAKAMIKSAEKIVNKRVGGQTLNGDIANAYHKHGKLLEGLNQHSKAQKSYSKAEKWGYLHVVSQHSGPSQSTSLSGSTLWSLFPPVALSATPAHMVAVTQGTLDLKITSPTPQGHTKGETHTQVNDQILAASAATTTTPQMIFVQDIIPPVSKLTLPKIGERFTSTPQLAYCLSLLYPSPISSEELDQSENDWLQLIGNNNDEQERLWAMATDIIRAFVRDELKTSDVVAETLSLAAVLKQDESRKLLEAFVDGIDQSLLLKVNLLDGLSHLMKNIPLGDLDSDDLVKILELLSMRLKGTHQQSTHHIYQLSLTVSHVLDSMVDSQVEGIEREQLHEPLSQYLKDLQQSSDPCLVYQAAYAYQALQYIPDDETILQTMLRRTGKVVKGISGVVSAVKALDLNGFIDGLQHIQVGLAGAGEVISIVNDAYQDAKSLVESGQGLLQSLQESFSFTRKSAWYPALRGLDYLLQEGKFTKFEKLIREAPCRKDPAFQWGVCQRLGELAANTLWDVDTRQCAISFLGEMYSNDKTWGQHISVKQLVLQILNKLVGSSEGTVADHAKSQLQDLEMDGDSKKRALYHACMQENQGQYILTTTSLSPRECRLLDRVQNKQDVESTLHQLKRERLREQGQDIYISPRAKVNASATDDFDLTSKVQEFLNSNKKVFLLLGDSGAGKSTFNRALEIDLWHKYDKAGGKIPLFIHLPAIKDLERDLVGERLRKANFTENQIRELKAHHEFILICDGYDESQQTRNLYTSNQLNQPSEWRAQMVISCRTEYTSVDYKNCFQPNDRNNSGNSELFQEAMIAPFNNDQIQDYINQYVDLRKPLWNSEEYQQALNQIPNLQDLVKNPFLLKLTLEVLPRLFDKNSEFSTTRITRVELYDEFVSQWIERGQKRFREMELSPRDKEAFKMLSDADFKQHGITFLKDLSTAIYDNQGGNPVINYSERLDHKTWKKTFFDNNDGKNLLREAIPLIRNNGQYRFIHKSVLDYGLSLAIFDPSTRKDITEPESRPLRRGSTSSTLSFETPDLIEEPATAIEQALLKSSFGRRSFVNEPSISQFLVERVQQEPVFKEQLHAVIERSKTDKTARIAAANAITVLVRAGVQFIGADLRGIKVPGADLSYGMFDSARLDGADLRKTDLRTIWLRKANLNGADMTGVQFGELPLLQENDIVMQCAYWHGGKTLAVGLINGGLKLYDTLSWQKIKEFEAYDDQRGWFLFSDTSDRVVYRGRDYGLRLVDVKTGNCFQILEGHTDSIQSAVYFPCGSKVASGGGDKTVRVWDVVTGECIHILQGHSKAVVGLVCSPSGDQIASASEDLTVRLWDVGAGVIAHVLKGHADRVYAVAYSPNGDQIASGGDDLSMRLWDVGTGSCTRILHGHTNSVNCVVYSPNGDQIASGSLDQTIRLWDVETGNCVHSLLGHSNTVLSIAFSPRGNQIASGSDDKTVRLWNNESNNFVRATEGHTNYVSSVAYSPNGSQIASGSYDKTLQLWNVDAGNVVRVLLGHTEEVYSVAYSPDGDEIGSGSFDGTVRLWNVETGNCIHTFQGHRGRVSNIAYSPNGDQIASASDDKTVRVWDVETGGIVHILAGHTDNVFSVSYSPKGDQIASGGRGDFLIRLWDVKTGNLTCVLQGHGDSIFSITYSPNGGQIASGSWDKTVRLWDIETGKCIHVFQGHLDVVSCVVYSPSGGQIASGSWDKTVRLWDIETGQRLAIISGFNGYVNSVSWKNILNGQYLVTGGNDKSVRHWKIIKEQDEYKVQLHWSSSHGSLTVAEASFSGVQGLSQTNQRLLSQHGAGALFPTSSLDS